jgi:phosphatidate cytidylyltransferase
MSDLVNQIAGQTSLTPNIVWALGAILMTLLVASAVRAVALLRPSVTEQERRSRVGSLITWWVLFAVLAAAVLLGRAVAVVLFAAVSLLGLREFRLLAKERIFALRVWWRLSYLAVPIHYLLIFYYGVGAFLSFALVWAVFIMMVRLVVTGQTKGFLETAGITFLGLMLIVFLLSHAVLVLWLPDAARPQSVLHPSRAPGAEFGLFIYLIVLTEMNDIAQALWGRQFGRHKITPTVSPNKTWEGFLLGATTTVVLSCVSAPWLTPFADEPFEIRGLVLQIPYAPALVAGVLIAVGGFFGDITMSAAKRDAGVKDTGTLLPGQGGVLDRIDSLTFTAPLFFYYTYTLYG